MPRGPRTGHAYRLLKAHVRQLARAGHPCILCGQPIDLERRYPDRWSVSVQHLTAVAQGGHPTDPSNAAPAHLYCNIRAGDRGSLSRPTPKPRPQRPNPRSRQW